MTERALQSAALKLIEAMGLRPFHIPNESARRRNVGARSGVPDICVLLPSGRTGWIELKTQDGKLSKEQVEWRDYLLRHQHLWAECRTLDEVEQVVGSWRRGVSRETLR